MADEPTKEQKGPNLLADERAAKRQIRDAETLAAERAGASIGRKRFLTGGDDPEHRERAEKEAREHASLVREWFAAQWDSEILTIGGVRMTNAEAQKSLNEILKDPKRHARDAVKQGLIRKDQVEDYTKTARELREINRKVRHGQMSREEKGEWLKENKGPVLDAVRQHQAMVHKWGQVVENERATRRQSLLENNAGGTQSLNAESMIMADDQQTYFPSAPRLVKEYQKAQAAKEPLETDSAKPASPQPPTSGPVPQTAATRNFSSMGLG